MTEVTEIDARESGQKWDRYRVGTFPVDCAGRTYTAYLRDYHPSWAGCVEFDVMAPDGPRAKRAAIAARKEREAGTI